MTENPTLIEMLALGLSYCRVAVDGNQGLLASLFLAGLIGSASHCIGMCGPFVLTQVGARLEALPASAMSEFARLRGAALVPYHLGRSVTYAGLGAAAAVLAGSAGAVGGLKWISAALLAFAALFFLAYGLKTFGVSLPWSRSQGGGGYAARISKLARPLLEHPLGWRGFALGLVLGFIPCGLLYGALAAAAATGNGVAGAIGMLAFVAGTVPALVAVGLAGHMAGQRWRAIAAKVAPTLMVINAVVLALMAWRLVA